MLNMDFAKQPQISNCFVKLSIIFWSLDSGVKSKIKAYG